MCQIKLLNIILKRTSVGNVWKLTIKIRQQWQSSIENANKILSQDTEEILQFAHSIQMFWATVFIFYTTFNRSSHSLDELNWTLVLIVGLVVKKEWAYQYLYLQGKGVRAVFKLGFSHHLTGRSGPLLWAQRVRYYLGFQMYRMQWFKCLYSIPQSLKSLQSIP